MTMPRANYFLKNAPGLITALLVLTSCTAVDVQSPYLTARPYQHYAAKADAWLLQSQQASGLLPYYFQPSTATAEPKNYRLGQLIAAERLARLTKVRSRVSTASKTQINAMRAIWPALSSEYAHDASRQINLGERALWLRILLLEQDSPEQPADHQAASLRSRFSAQAGFHEQLNPASTDSRFMQRLFTGHAALALFEHAGATNNADSLKIADAALNWLDAHYSMQEKGNFHPTLAPWHTFAIAAQYQLNGASPHLGHVVLR